MAGTGMLTAQKTMDVITNNVTNVETVGYKGDKMLSQTFASMLIERIHDPSVIATREVGPLEPGVHIDRIVTSFTQGAFDGSERDTDLALAGAGWFVVDTPEGERYTRAGNFFVNPEGYLTNVDGHYVVGQSGGPIQVGTDEFVVSEDGAIQVEGVTVGALRLVTFDDDSKLRKQGDNLYYNHEGAQEIERGCIVKQHYLEMSNVDVGATMVDMMVTYRLYEANQRILQMTDETLGKAVNDIAKPN
jgi:flagellar basal-body rod protein FlgG